MGLDRFALDRFDCERLALDRLERELLDRALFPREPLERDLFALDRFERDLLALERFDLPLFALGRDWPRCDLDDLCPDPRRSLPAVSEASVAPMLGVVRFDTDEALVSGTAAKNNAAVVPSMAIDRTFFQTARRAVQTACRAVRNRLTGVEPDVSLLVRRLLMIRPRCGRSKRPGSSRACGRRITGSGSHGPVDVTPGPGMYAH